MTTKKRLVTRAAAFSGSHLSNHLISLGYKVSEIDNHPNGNLENISGAMKNSNLNFAAENILDKPILLRLYKECNYFFHLAFLPVRYSIMMNKQAIIGFDIVFLTSNVARQLNENIESNSSIFLKILGMGFSQASIYYDKTKCKIGKSKWTISKK